jgi:hypothetical protein
VIRSNQLSDLNIDAECADGLSGEGAICGESKIKWAGNQEAVTFLGYRPIRS